MYKKILAPLDGSKLAECVVDHIKSVATGCHVPAVVLLRVIPPISASGNAPDAMKESVSQGAREAAEIQAKNYLNEMAENLTAEGVAVETEIADGAAADEILNYAEENDIDLIIMSTHGKSGLSRWFSGSVADRVIHHSMIPVLIVVPRGCRISRK